MNKKNTFNIYLSVLLFILSSITIKIIWISAFTKSESEILYYHIRQINLDADELYISFANRHYYFFIRFFIIIFVTVKK